MFKTMLNEADLTKLTDDQLGKLADAINTAWLGLVEQFNVTAEIFGARSYEAHLPHEAMIETHRNYLRVMNEISRREDARAETAECPCCTKDTPVSETGATTCQFCGAMFGDLLLAESLEIVRAEWHDGPDTLGTDAAFYYDFRIVDNPQIGRRHGWADRQSRKILQTG